jgi:zinc transport system substrate-binding protein
MKMKRPLLAALLLSSLAAPAGAEVPKVVTDIPAVQSLAAAVMGNLGRPAILLGQGANAHSYQLKPSQAAELQAADLVFWVGPEMTPWLDRAIAGLSAHGKAVGLLAAPGTHRQAFAAEPGPAHVDEDGDVHEGTDPHAWLDPTNAGVWLSVMAAELSAADPEHAATYAANAAAAKAGVAALDAEIAADLAPVAGRPFVVFHEAYGYFATHYGLSVAGSVAMGDATAPGAAHLAGLRAELAGKGVVCAFPETNHDPKQIDQLLEGTGVKRGGALDPEGAALPYGPGLYADLMRGLAQTLAACLAQ